MNIAVLKGYGVCVCVGGGGVQGLGRGEYMYWASACVSAFLFIEYFLLDSYIYVCN